jgi:glycogen operon protein
MLAYAKRVLALRREHPVFRRRRFFQTGGGVSFYRLDGTTMGDDARDQAGPCAAAVFLDGGAIADPGPDGVPVRDSRSFLLLLNAGWEPVTFTIPPDLPGSWRADLATEHAHGLVAPRADLPLARPGRSLLVLSRPSR